MLALDALHGVVAKSMQLSSENFWATTGLGVGTIVCIYLLTRSRSLNKVEGSLSVGGLDRGQVRSGHDKLSGAYSKEAASEKVDRQKTTGNAHKA